MQQPTTTTNSTVQTAIPQPDPGLLGVFDQWMRSHSWHPRAVPFVVYILMIIVVGLVHDWEPRLYPVIYTVQCGLVGWLLWRYRKLVPELTITFHWLSIPVGLGVAAGWIWLGMWSQRTFGDMVASEPQESFFVEMGLAIGWIAMSLRLIGMSVVVPLFEELFIRSLILRGFHRMRPTVIGIVQVAQEIPVLGEWLMHTRIGEMADQEPPAFRNALDQNPLGALSVFGVFASTVVFTAHHIPRDWAGCVMCALAYCFLLAATRRHGLGPTCWAHGITNATLWAYTLHTGDWQFL